MSAARGASACLQRPNAAVRSVDLDAGIADLEGVSHDYGVGHELGAWRN
jgi:hypothetical protein